MSLQIGAALKGGLDLIVSRTGAMLLVTYLALYAVYQTAFNGLARALYERAGFEEAAAGLQPAIDAPVAVTGAFVGACLLIMTYLTVVAVRTFVAGERESVPRDALTGGVVFAVLNLLVGGLVLSVLTTIGFVLLVVPGLFLLVSFLFMTMYVAVENENFVTAMRHSWGLTRGERFAVFGLLLVVMAIGFAVGLVVGIAGFVGVLAGVDQAAIGIANVVVVAPVTLYNLAVLSNAFNQLRADEPDEPGAGAVAPDAPGSPA